MNIRHGLRVKIFLLSATIIIIPLLVLSAFVMKRTINLAEENVRNYQLASVKKTGQAVENIFGELERASIFIIGDPEIREYLSEGIPDSTKNIYNTLIYLRNTSGYIKAIQIENMEGEILASGSMPFNITQKDRQEALEKRGKSFWGQDVDIYGETYVYLCRLLRDTEDPSRHLGIAKLYLDGRSFQEYLRRELEAGMDYMILDQESQVLFDTGFLEIEGETKLEYQELLEENGNCSRFTSDEEEYYRTTYQLETNDWILCGVSETGNADHVISATLYLLAILSVSCFAVCVILALFLSRHILTPLMEVIRHMDTFGHQDFSTRIQVKGEGEAALLARHFNKMAEKIEDLIRRVYEEELYKREAELRALQSQINPHFLYNTLDIAYWTAKMENATQTSEMIDCLSHFFRSALIINDEFTTVENEIEHLRYYIILRRQGKNPFDFELDYQEETLSCQVVKLVLQPLVENAIIHGITGMKNGKISVAIFIREERLIYRIEDNGKGVDPEDMKQLLSAVGRNHRGLGIKNINDRNRLAYGEEYGLIFEKRPQGGTCIIVTQPFKPGGETDD